MVFYTPNIVVCGEEICDYAQKNPDTKFFVFIDEIDSIMMIDESINSDHNNKMLNEFKKCFTDKLGQHENIITVGATNLDIVDENPFSNKKLDKAMLDRFQEKILVDLPTSKQIKGAIMERYKNLPMVEDELKQDNERLGAICEFLANLKTVSFRHLDSFFDDAATYKDEAKVDIEAFFRAIQNKKTELKIPEDKLQKLAQEIKVEY